MKIDQANIQQSGGAGGAQQTGGAQQVRGSQGATSSRSAYGLGSDSVSLSSLSEAVRSYTTADSPERSHAIAQIVRDIGNGKYQIDPRAVSQGVIADAQLA